MASIAMNWMSDERTEPRDAVQYRSRAAHPDGRVLPLVIVNTSAAGLMARCDAACEPGDRLRIDLPQVGPTLAEVRWSLGGRLGCRFERPFGFEEYYTLLTALRR